MRLESLYRACFIYPEGWAINIMGEQGSEGQHLYFAEGSVQGRINGRFRASNFPRRRTDNTFTPNFHGVIQTDDDAAILFEYHGYGRAYPANRRQWVVSAIHLSEDPRYQWLNDVICVGTGEVRARMDAEVGGGGARPRNPTADLFLEVAELIWEPIAE
jgi:Protein of unknown function (DUF3237)